jgi:hypothetical protein
MPYFITDKSQDCSGWAVTKQNGEVIGCHKTKQSAIKQMVAVSLAEKMQPGGERALNDELEVGDFVFWENAGHTEFGLITLVSTYGVVTDQLGATMIATQDRPLAKISVYELVIDRLVGTDRFVVKSFAPLTKLEMNDHSEDNSDPDQDNMDEDQRIEAKVPAYMRAAARRGLEYVKEGKGGDGLKQQTINEARQMASGEVSDDKWIRMAAWIARHLGDLDSPEANPQHPNYPSAGVVAHLLWGSGPSKTKARAAMDYSQGVVERIRNEERHLPGKHSQKSHGGGGGRISSKLTRSVLEKVRANGGLSVNMLSGNEPTGGYMVAKGTNLGDIVSADDFYDETKITGILSDYFKKNKSELSGSDNYLGIWHNTEDGQVYLDVSQNILDRTEAIIAGQTRDQISIWDVVNFEEIGTGGTGDIRTNRHSEDSGHFRNDGSGDRSTINADSKTDLSRKREAAERIIRHLPGKHAQKSHGGGRGGGGGGLTANEAAKQVYKKAVGLEPQITKQIQDLTAANGGELIGLKNRLKTVESLERKIADKARDEFGGDHKAAAADISDSVRYTMELDPNNYGDGVKNTIDILNEQGYQTRVKNYWQEGNIYKGVNATVTSPDGQKFELQFHTKDSYSLKETFNNRLYQEHRLSGTSAARKFELEQQMANNWVSVQTPANLDLLATIGKPVLQLPARPIQ